MQYKFQFTITGLPLDLSVVVSKVIVNFFLRKTSIGRLGILLVSILIYRFVVSEYSFMLSSIMSFDIQR